MNFLSKLLVARGISRIDNELERRRLERKYRPAYRELRDGEAKANGWLYYIFVTITLVAETYVYGIMGFVITFLGATVLSLLLFAIGRNMSDEVPEYENPAWGCLLILIVGALIGSIVFGLIRQA